MALHFTLESGSINDLTVEFGPEALRKVDESEIRSTFLPSEWYPQSGVQITWPHNGTDWAPILDDVQDCYIRIALEIAERERLIIITPEPDVLYSLLQQRLPQKALSNISLHQINTNDTWARDHGFITLLTSQGPVLLDFRFNGWGQKFAASLDNQICRKMVEQHILHGTYEGHLNFVLEGGSIESDGRGTILTTTKCLMAPNRNEPLCKEDIQEHLLRFFHAERLLWLDYGYLAGDDTDSHIDTLARFCPNDTIVYVQCQDKDDEHYCELKAMEKQLHEFRTLKNQPYRLLPLPMAAIEYDNKGNRLPATYANFLIINGAVLMPTYRHPEIDEQARTQLQKAFPKHTIIGIDCRVLIEQHGSLHCCTMQYPIGVIK